MVGDSTGDLGPEGLRVIGLEEMAEFVHDDVIGELGREKGDAIVEVEVAQAARAAPLGALLADADPADARAVYLVEVLKSRVHERTSRCDDFLILLPSAVVARQLDMRDGFAYRDSAAHYNKREAGARCVGSKLITCRPRELVQCSGGIS